MHTELSLSGKGASGYVTNEVLPFFAKYPTSLAAIDACCSAVLLMGSNCRRWSYSMPLPSAGLHGSLPLSALATMKEPIGNPVSACAIHASEISVVC